MKIFKKKWFWIVVIILAIGGWFLSTRQQPPQYETITAGRGTVTEIVNVTGEIEPVTYADMAFEVSGMVEKVYVAVGDRVEKGDILVSLDDSALQARLREAKTAADIAYQNEKLARRDWDDLDPEEREIKKLASQQARENAAIIAEQFSDLTLVAPMDGLVTQMNVNEGERVLPSIIVARVIDDSEFQLTADVPESDVADLQVGQEATATFDAFERNDELPVTLSYIEPEPNQIQDVVYYTAKFFLNNGDSRLRSGMTTDIEIRVGESDDTLYLPFRALHDDEERTYVEVLVGGAVEERTVETGLEDDEGNVEILSGIDPGDQIVVGTIED